VTIEIGPKCIGQIMAPYESFTATWVVHPGAVLLVGWIGKDGNLAHRLFDSSKMSVEDGARVTIKN
jgi:hypothetical protein